MNVFVQWRGSASIWVCVRWVRVLLLLVVTPVWAIWQVAGEELFMSGTDVGGVQDVFVMCSFCTQINLLTGRQDGFCVSCGLELAAGVDSRRLARQAPPALDEVLPEVTVQAVDALSPVEVAEAVVGSRWRLHVAIWGGSLWVIAGVVAMAVIVSSM